MDPVAVAIAALLVGISAALGWFASGRRRRKPPQPGSEEYYRKQARARYREAFRQHHALAALIEPAIAFPRPLDNVTRMALDMLLTQAYKTHYAVSLLAERGQAEDAATMTRRLLELATQAIYIGGESDPKIRSSRAGAYLAHLWRSSGEDLRNHLRPLAAQEWERIHNLYEKDLPKTRTRWGPRWDEMFELIGRKDTYTSDYRLLSGIAHGSTAEALLVYSTGHVEVRSHHHTPALLRFSNRYYAAIAGQWNNYFGLIPDEQFQQLLNDIMKD